MTDLSALTSLHGRRIGLSKSDHLILPKTRGVAEVTITTTQLLALNATEQEIIPAPGVGFAIVPILTTLIKPAGTAYAGVAAGEDLVLKYTDSSGAECSGHVETTGFLDSTSKTIAVVGFNGANGAVGSVVPVENAAVVLHLLVGEVITGDSDLLVHCEYKKVPTDFLQ